MNKGQKKIAQFYENLTPSQKIWVDNLSPRDRKLCAECEKSMGFHPVNEVELRQIDTNNPAKEKGWLERMHKRTKAG